MFVLCAGMTHPRAETIIGRLDLPILDAVLEAVGISPDSKSADESADLERRLHRAETIIGTARAASLTRPIRISEIGSGLIPTASKIGS